MSTVKALAFETCYRRYPFAPLVELGLVIAAWLNRPAADAGNLGELTHDAGVSGGAVGGAA